MKNSKIISIQLFIYIFAVGLDVFAQADSGNLGSNNVNSSTTEILDYVKVCNWKGGASTCLNLSFDDNNYSGKKMSQIIDRYGFKATFFVISSYMYVDSLTAMYQQGHEIGSHTYAHIDLTSLDSIQIDYQIRKGKELIENTFGIKCLSFTEPGHLRNFESSIIAFKYHQFIRDYSEYPQIQHIAIPYNGLTIDKLMSLMKTGIKTGALIELAGHGMDGENYQPVPKDFFVQTLDSVKRYSEKGDLWVSTIKEGISYENLYHELILNKELHSDTLILNFKNYIREKYKDMVASPISIEIPVSICNDISSLNDDVEIKKKNDRFIITSDLMRDTTLVLKLNGFTRLNDTIVMDNGLQVYPNPVNDILSFNCNDEISMVEIYNLQGNLIFKQKYNIPKIDVSMLSNGFYILKVDAKKNNSKLIYRSKFIKLE